MAVAVAISVCFQFMNVNYNVLHHISLVQCFGGTKRPFKELGYVAFLLSSGQVVFCYLKFPGFFSS